MARVYSQKSRKVRTCQKCGKTINVGDMYFSAQPYGRAEMIRCSCCRPERSEMTSSDYYAWLWNLQDHLSDNYDLTSDVAEELVSELEGQRDELEEKLYNMPEQLQDSDSGQTLQDRISSLEDAISELENLEYPDEDDDEYKTEDDNPTCVKVERSIEGEDGDDSFCDLFCDEYEDVKSILEEFYGYTEKSAEDYDETVGGKVVFVNGDNENDTVTVTFEKKSHKDEEAYEEALNEYSSSIEEIIGNIE